MGEQPVFMALKATATSSLAMLDCFPMECPEAALVAGIRRNELASTKLKPLLPK